MTDFKEKCLSSIDTNAKAGYWQFDTFLWFQTTFNAPGGNDPLALDMNTMGKGQIWINGQSIGRYWPAYKANGKCSACHYTGWYDEKKCGFNCGEASQKW